ncbi:hypothetical protein COV19_02820 [Candidatus Woesearchaeota archaeon CG10_big_fil_rev_8_21_14_0_10_44_13]|nr:MAG: hypothetical protein COV19_02820 [Candidatus Woesearchaeota archaeon CG10_big_fil_rev_8_21_14_0_10_44_13]
MKFNTKLWKRSQKSFATTIPHIVLLGMNESVEHDVVWEYDSDMKKWTFSLEPKKTRAGKDGKSSSECASGAKQKGGRQ